MNPPPEDDSEDLTDQQIAQAVETTGAGDLAVRLTSLSCSICGRARPELQISHALRRRAPHLYSRTHIRCLAGHEEMFVFTVDWLKN